MANITKVALVNKGKVVGGGRNKDNSNLAPIESTTTASRAYSVGNYLMLQGEFYRVISAISIGDTLTVGTNIQSTNVGNELSKIKKLTATLTAGSTTLTFTDASITATSLCDLYCGSEIDYESVTSATGSITYTFEAQSSDVTFTLVVINL